MLQTQCQEHTTTLMHSLVTLRSPSPKHPNTKRDTPQTGPLAQENSRCGITRAPLTPRFPRRCAWIITNAASTTRLLPGAHGTVDIAGMYDDIRVVSYDGMFTAQFLQRYDHKHSSRDGGLLQLYHVSAGHQREFPCPFYTPSFGSTKSASLVLPFMSYDRAASPDSHWLRTPTGAAASRPD